MKNSGINNALPGEWLNQHEFMNGLIKKKAAIKRKFNQVNRKLRALKEKSDLLLYPKN